MRVVLVGNPGGPRVAGFAAALARRGWAPPAVVSWLDVLAGRDRLADLVTADALVRLDSPGRDFEVERHLLARGADVPDDEDTAASHLPADAARELEFEKGRVLFPRQWYRGFRAVLRELDRRFPHARWLNPPADVIDLFDKRRCRTRLAGVAAPAALGPVRSFDELLTAMRSAGRMRVFVKLACGSSGSGVVAFAVGRGRLQAMTTVELVRRGGRWVMFNSRRLRRYESPDEVAALFDTLCPEGVVVEGWVPKAAMRGLACDLRVLAIGGEPRHAVVRLSRTPLTNLHLLNDRADADELRALVPVRRWEAVLADVRRAAAAFPGCLHLGVDLAFAAGFRHHAVLEANAFGDLLPGVAWGGMDTYEAQAAWLEAGVTSR